LPKSRSIPRFTYKLHPIARKGVVRVGGKLENADVDFELKHPIIVSSNCHLTELVIRQYHHEVGHSGTNHPWSAIRRRYWILKGSAAVRQTIGQCTLCKRRNEPVS